MAFLPMPSGWAPTAVLSPDGRWVAVEVGSSAAHILIYASRTGAPRALIKDATWNGTPHAQLAWSPDSRRLVFYGCVSRRDASGDSREGAFVARGDGGDRRRLGSVASARFQTLGSLVWSPDGWIAYDSANVVEEIRPSGRAQHLLFRIQPDLDGSGNLQWSPDGSRVIDWMEGSASLVRTRHGVVVGRIPSFAVCQDEPDDAYWCGNDAAWTTDSRRVVFSLSSTRSPATWIVVADQDGHDVLTIPSRR